MSCKYNVFRLAAYLKRLREEPAYYRQKAEAGKKYIEDRLSMDRCADTIRARMEAILGTDAKGTSSWT